MSYFSISKTEDLAHSSGDVGVQLLAVRKGTPANLSGTDGDYEPLQLSAGRLWTSTLLDTALPAGTNNIGDIDVLTVPADPFGVNADAASATGSISAKLRFIASTGIPITGTVTVGSHAVTNAGTFVVQENGSALTALQLIDDTVVAQGTALGTTKNSLIGGSVTTNAPTYTTGQINPFSLTTAGELRVNLASVPSHAVTNAGTFAVQATLSAETTKVIGTVNIAASQTIATTNAGTFVVQEDGAALTSLQLIDDTVFTLGTSTYTEATSKGLGIGAVRRDADTTLVNTTNEWGPLQMDANGRLKVEAFSGETLPVSLTSTTVTGTVAVTQSGTWDEVGINDSGNSITVDAPVGTPVFVRLSDGAAAITTLAVSLASVPSHAVTNAGTFAVQVDGNALTSLQLMDDVVYTDDAAFTVGTSKIQGIGLIADETSTDSVDEGDIGAPRMTLDRKQITSVYAHTTGGWTPYKLISAGTTNATSVKGSAGQLGSIVCFNLNASPRYVKLYNKATAPTVGTDTPVQVYMIPGNTTGAGFVIPPTPGLDFTTGIAFAITTGITDADNTAVAANEIIVNLGYK